MVLQIKLSGTFYEVGYQLGQRMSKEVQHNVKCFRESDVYGAIERYLGTSKGHALYGQLKETTYNNCSDYVQELRGVAEGSNVSFDDLLHINFSPEYVAALGLVPEGSHGVKYSSVYAGCTNISLDTADNVYFAHTEDIGVDELPAVALLSVHIVDPSGQLVEAWTDSVVAGVCPGSKFGFNSHGVMMAHNNVYQKGVYSCGIPRRFMGRALMGVRSPDEAFEKLKAQPGIASAYTFCFLQRKPNGQIINRVFEVFGSLGADVTMFEPRGFYHHCNIFQHSDCPCHPEESSVHRAAVLSQYVNRYQHRATVDTVIAAISDRADKKFPVYRNGQSPDYLATGSTGLFDVNGGKMYVFTDVPSQSKPTFTYDVTCTDALKVT